jgi:hypothetical protein
LFLVFIWISEVDFDERAASSWVMKNGTDNSSNVSLPLREIKVTISGRSDSVGLGSGVNTTDLTLSLA